MFPQVLYTPAEQSLRFTVVMRLAAFAVPLTTTPVTDAPLGCAETARDLFIGGTGLIKLVELLALISCCPHTS